MSFRSSVAGIGWPAISPAPGATLLALLFQFEQSQWWPAERLRARQYAQLGQLFEYLWPRSPFHRARLEGAGWRPGIAIDDDLWQALPRLDRATLQRERATLAAHPSPPQHGRLMEFATTGSLGMPVQGVGNELTHLFNSALVVRNHLWQQRRFAGKFAAIRTKSGSGHFPNWGVEAAAFETGPLAVLDIATEIDRQLDWLAAEAPDYLLTHPSNLRALLLRARQRGLSVPSLRELSIFGEMPPRDLRKLADEIWSLPLVDSYSCEEFGTIALQCPKHPDHLHVQAENLLLEILDQSGAPCAPGQTGRVVLTTLHNFSMPLIRYEIGDYATAGPPCPCGRGLPVLTGIAGRRRNMLSGRDGRRHWPSFPYEALREISDFSQLQLVQHSLDELEVRLAGVAPLPSDREAAFAERLCDLLHHPFDVRFSYADTLSPAGGGKFEDYLNLVDSPPADR